ncbi:MAG: sigma 54-interacting transcriptional regulator [Desulfobulbaceae bacterium]|nr:sigma 54-interacting transcriptional regulator [Desulfobulbaceae bacterium]
MIDISKEESRILVVDDEESLRLTFKTFLAREGYGPVTVASTFDEALDLIENNTYDLIVSDIVLEGASGIDLLRRAKELNHDCPVVMVTGYPNIKSASEAVRLGAFDYLAKPVKKEDLLRTARMALQQYSLLKVKETLEEEKERYRQNLETIFRSVQDIIITVDPDLEVVLMNDRAKQLAAKAIPELTVGANLQKIDSVFTEACQQDALIVLQSQEELPEHRIEFQMPDGGLAVLRISAAPLVPGTVNLHGVVFVARDVSRLESLEQRGRRQHFHRLIGSSQAMQTVYTLIENVGQVDTSVLITGESGTGKELVAEALHAESPRKDMPLIKVDCTAIPENLLESELFGHKKGSFTGADRNREGRILQADGGTLFLDEIGDISSTMQLRLLRFLQERTFYPVGHDMPLKVDVRVIAATNADLKQKVVEGGFREDLYYRLRVIDIVLPPLREREEDLPLLAKHFLEKFNKRLGKNIAGISDQALSALADYNWPGNVRELEHIMERACVLCNNTTITTDHLSYEFSETVHDPARRQSSADDTNGSGEPEPPLDSESEHDRIVRILVKCSGNKAKAARLLGIDRSTLYRKMRLYNIDPAVY